MLRIIKILLLKFRIRWHEVEIESSERLLTWRKMHKRNLEARLRSAYHE